MGDWKEVTGSMGDWKEVNIFIEEELNSGDDCNACTALYASYR